MALPLLLLWSLIVVHLRVTVAFRVFDASVDEYEAFAPYAQGFVGRLDAAENLLAEAVNEGSFRSPAQPSQWDRFLGAQVCPGMVGPVEGQYFCRSQDFGRCDRRTGACSCEAGYAGIDCGDCRSTHFERGGLCYPKRLCPESLGSGICSGAGTCDYARGECECFSHRRGRACEAPRCHLFDDLCETCTNTSCVSCIEGFFVSEDNNCVSCSSVHDPRCRHCDTSRCLECVDPLLWSIRRSGPRNHDPLLPFDELTRELSVATVYGSQTTDIFREAEPYRVVVVKEKNATLRTLAHGCDQQLEDASWNCSRSVNISHVVCGHEGTLSWSSPTYAVAENAGVLRLTLRRTGGGFGEVHVQYVLHHLTTSPSDVSGTVAKTTDTTVYFHHGTIEASVLIAIHDDRLFEGDETFVVELREVRGGAILGPQKRATVVVVDDDAYRTTANFSQFRIDPNGIAGEAASLGVAAFSGAGKEQRLGGDLFLVDLAFLKDEKATLIIRGTSALEDLGNGSYVGNWSGLISGDYVATAYLAVPGGLRGDFFNDVFLGQKVVSRMDRTVDFHWGLGPLTSVVGPNFSSARWSGRLRPEVTGFYNITVRTTGHLGARLWLDDRLLIDAWDPQRRPCGTRTAPFIALLESTFHVVVLELRVARDGGQSARRRNDPFQKTISLEWQTEGLPSEIIPARCLFVVDELPKEEKTFVRVVSATTDAFKTFVEGDGDVEVGEPLEFEVFLRDAFGNSRDDVRKNFLDEDANWYHPHVAGAAGLLEEADNLRANLTLEVSAAGAATKGSSYLPSISFSFDENVAMSTGTAYPTIAGTYRVDVAYGASPVAGSPFRVIASPQSRAFAARSRPFNVPETGVAGEALNFSVIAIDAFGNERRKGGDLFEVRSRFTDFQSGDDSSQSDWSRVGAGTFTEWQQLAFFSEENVITLVAEGFVFDLGNGWHSATVTPTIAGRHEISVTLDGLDLAESPFVVAIRNAKAEAFSSTAEGRGLLQGRVNETAFLVVTARDRFGNPVIDADVFSVKMLQSNNGTCDENLGNGSVICSYVPLVSGTAMALSVLFGGEHIRNSPFYVAVATAKPFGPLSNVSGAGLRKAEAGVPAFFQLTVKDVGGNTVLQDRESNVTVVLASGDAVTVVGVVSTLNATTFLASYTATVSGFYELDVRVAGLGVFGNPFSVYVRPNAAASAKASRVKGKGIDEDVVACVDHEIVLTVFDRFGNRHLNSTLDRLVAYAEIVGDGAKNGSTGAFSEKVRIDGRPLTQGLYDLSYVPRVAGHHSTKVFVLEPGLDVDYFGERDLSRYLGSRVDANLNLLGNDTSSRSDFFSVRWRGLLRFPKVEDAYAFLLESDDSSTARLLIDGTELLQCAQTSSWGTGSFTPRLKDATFLDDLVHSVTVEYEHGIDFSFLRLFWKVPGDINWTRVPDLAFSRSVLVDEFANDVYAGSADAAKSTVAETKATYVATANNIIGVVEVRDSCGNLRAGSVPGTDSVAVVAFGTSANERRAATIEALGDGQYQATMLLPVAGSYTLMAVIGPEAAAAALRSVATTTKDAAFISRARAEMDFLGAQITRSAPWIATSTPGSPAAATSYASVLDYEVQAGDTQKVFVVARDLSGNRVDATTVVTVKLVLRQRTNDEKVARSERHVDAVTSAPYEFEVTPVIAGRYELSIQIDGEDIKGSPYRLDCLPGPGNASRTSPKGTLPVTARANVAAEPSRRFLLQARDRYGNDHRQGGLTFRALLRSTGGIGSSVGVVDDRKDGTYAVRLSSTNLSEGHYEIDVQLLQEEGNGLTGAYFANGGLLQKAKLVRIDSGPTEHDFGTGEVTPSVVDYASVRWTGFLLAPRTATFDFHISVGADDDEARFFIGGHLVVVSSSASSGTHKRSPPSSSFDVIEGAVYDVALEFEHATGHASVALRWSSDYFESQAIPGYYLFPAASHIDGSPFAMRLVHNASSP